MFKNKPTPNITLSALWLWKKPFCAPTLKELEKHSIFIVNSSKTSRYYLCFINRAGRGHFCSINRSAGKSYPCTTIEKAMFRLELAGVIFALLMEVVVGVIFAQLLKTTSKEDNFTRFA